MSQDQDNAVLQQLLSETLQQGKQLERVCESMEKLMGNGQPGLIRLMQDDIERLQAADNKRLGFSAAFALIITGWEVVKHFFKIQ